MSIIKTYLLPHPPLIIPSIGKGDETKINDTIKSFDKIANEIAKDNPDTIIVITPHSIMYSDYIHISPGKSAKGDFGRFGADNISFDVQYDEELANEIENAAIAQEISAGTLGEKDSSLDHGTMIPLYFINKYIKDYNIIRIGISGLSLLEHYKFGKCINKAVEKLGRRVVLIASGDLSHKLNKEGPYGFAKEGLEFDKKMCQIIKSGDFIELLKMSPDLCEMAAECGLRAFIIMTGAIDGKEIISKFLSYEGPFGVGYCTAYFNVIGENEDRRFDEMYERHQLEMAKSLQEKESNHVKLARKSIEYYLSTGKYLDLSEGLTDEFYTMRAGVFVSLYRHDSLRGCIGTISPVTTSIGQEIIKNAVSAATQDPRFAPLAMEELADLVISVDVLSEAEAIDTMEDLDVLNYGVIVTSGRKRGLLLPNLDGIDTVEEQVEIARKKAGIYDNESFSLERFKVVRYTWI